MASTTRLSSFLPSIKCSNCGREIEISRMGDHVCGQASPQPANRLRQQPLDGPFAPSPFKYTRIEAQRPRAALPKIDSSLANRPYRPNAFLPSRPTNLSRSESPNPSIKYYRSPFSPLNRSATLPLTPPSPEARSQDGAFPMFPTTKSKSRSNTPTTWSEPSHHLPIEDTDLQSPPDQFGVFAPLSTKRRGENEVLKRLDAISPGPFDANKDRDIRQLGHKRTGTSSSREDFIHSLASASFKGHSPHSSSAASSTNNRNASVASLPFASRRNKSVEDANLSTISTGLSKPSELLNSYDKTNHEKSSSSIPSRPALGQLDRSQTSPVESTGLYGWEESNTIMQRIDSEPPQPKPSLHRPSPSVAAAIRPLDEIGSMSSFKPSRSLRGRKESTKTDTTDASPPSKSEARNDQRLQDAPPVPRPAQALDFGIGNPYHFSTESASSNDSSGSDVKTSSSRSSPPLSDSPQRPKRKADTTRLDNLLRGFQLDLDDAPISEPPELSHWGPPPSFSRPTYSQPSPNRESAKLSPTTKSSPASWDGPPPSHAPAISQEGYFSLAYPIEKGTLSGPPAPSPLPPQAPLPRPQRPATNKGNCKGCGELITGKSVSSADGRLTGRYHKSCFVCETCKEPFQTADFYVMHNHPYCGRHYHQLNGSLCKTCDRGIEGQYLETELQQKFHPHCFTCQDCHQILRDDYFEMNGKTYCERHANRIAERTRFLGPGRRHPERRTTRLMMM